MMRALGAADAPAAAALIRTAFAAQGTQTDPPSGALRESAESVAGKIASGGGACIEREGRMDAVVLWGEQDGGLYLGRLAVNPACRGQGLARRLIDEAEAEARRRNLPRMTIIVRLELLENRRLFEARGFVQTGFYTHNGFAAPTGATMEKPLPTEV